MRLFLALFLLITPLAYAQRTLSRESFQANVRPVLNGILSDFYQMISLFPNFPKEIVPLIRELDQVNSDKELLRETCPRVIDKKCQDTISNLRERLRSLRAQTLTVLARLQTTNSPYLNTLTGTKYISQFDVILEEVKGELDNASFLLTAKIPQKKETYDTLKKFDELGTLLSLSLVEFIPFQYREDFRHFYFNYVHPIQQQISRPKNFEYINRNIESLNFAFNLLNQNLTKRNKKTPEGMAPYLSVIHNRWNSLLRYYY